MQKRLMPYVLVSALIICMTVIMLPKPFADSDMDLTVEEDLLAQNIEEGEGAPAEEVSDEQSMAGEEPDSDSEPEEPAPVPDEGADDEGDTGAPNTPSTPDIDTPDTDDGHTSQESEPDKPNETDVEATSDKEDMDEPALEVSMALFADEGEDEPLSGNCGANLIWTLDKNGTLVISGSGTNITGFADLSDKTSVSKVIIPAQVTAIAPSAFGGFTNLGTVIFRGPYHSGLIGSGAFSGLNVSFIVPTGDESWNDFFDENGDEKDVEIEGGGTAKPSGGTIKDAFPATGTCGNSTVWELNRNGELTITLTDSQAQTVIVTSGDWGDYVDSIREIVIGGNFVTKIEKDAFSNLTNLKKIRFDFPLTDITIDPEAFRGVEAVVTVPEVAEGETDTWYDFFNLANQGGGLLYRDTATRLAGNFAISGTPIVGSTLTADTSQTNANAGTIAYSWERIGTEGNEVVSTSGAYILTADDLGKQIRCTISATGDKNVFYGSLSATVGPIQNRRQPTPVGLVGVAPVTADGTGTIRGLDDELTYQYSTHIDFTNASEIDNTTLIQGVLPGTTYYVRVKASDTLDASEAVTVWIPTFGGDSEVEATDITIFPQTNRLTLQVGDGYQLRAAVEPDNASDKTVQWTSMDASVVSVTTTGYIHAVSKGSAVIRATATGGTNVQDSILITVVESPEDEDGEDIRGDDYSTTNSDLAGLIRDASIGSTIHIDYSGNTTLSKSVFDAIKGKNKTIRLYGGNGVEWIFNGTSITGDTKSIQLSSSVEMLPNSSKPTAGGIAKIVNGIPSIVVTFPNNGQLPGPATVRVPISAAMRSYLGTNTLNVYYYDEVGGRFALIRESVPIGSDGYAQFTISHCSTYVLTARAIQSGSPATQTSDATTKTSRIVRTKRAPKTGE